MPEFREELLQFIWQQRLFKPVPLSTVRGQTLEIIRPGELNRHAGPDFFNGLIRINGLLMAGNIELHLKSSDWLRHQHESDRSYDNIILHVVYEHDVELRQNQFFNVDVLELKELIAPDTIERYRDLESAPEELPCSRHIGEVDDLKFSAWIQRMGVERLERKVEQIENLFRQFNGDFIQTFCTLFFRCFGFKVNAEPFEQLARQIPIHTLMKHADDLFQLEALLLGTAGLLDHQHTSPYLQKIQNEYGFLEKKYRLIRMEPHLFKFSRMRPANFPTVRLAQLAELLNKKSKMFVSPHLYESCEEIMRDLNVKLRGFWQNHYDLSQEARKIVVGPGRQSKELIVINVFAPFYFFYGKKTAQEIFCAKALEFLNDCARENNYKTRFFSRKNSQITDSGASQGLIHLHDNYCLHKKCLDCGIGTAILKR